MGILHILTPEYPPQDGGVSNYTEQVAWSLAHAGDEVHVWCPRVGEEQGAKSERKRNEVGGRRSEVRVHQELGRIRPADLIRVGGMLDRFPGPRRLLVQWVPHAFGMRAMNIPFCFWMCRRASKGDVVEIMAHECYLPFKRRAWRQNFAALVQRLMAMILLRATHRVWVSIPAWEKRWRPLALGRKIPFTWLPVPSNIPVSNDDQGIADARARFGINGEPVIGHFGTYNPYDREVLKATLSLLLNDRGERKAILMGRNSDVMRNELITVRPDLSGRIYATGRLDAQSLSLHLSACDVLLQPCQDGVSTRRGAIMACLAHGRPIVTTTGCLTEPIWSHSKALVLVPDRNVRALVEKTITLLNDKTERQRLGDMAREFYYAKFDVRYVTDSLRESSEIILCE